MKYIALHFLFFLLAVPAAQSQNKKELSATLQRDVELFKRYSLRADFDSIFHFTPPAMFDLVPKDSMVSMMRQTMFNEMFSIELNRFDITTPKPKIKKAGEYFWAFVEYDGGMKFHFHEEGGMSSFMIMAMKSEFGEKNVKTENDSTLSIVMPGKRMILFKDPALSRWLFVEDKRGEKGDKAAMQKMVYEAIVPEVVRKAVDKKK